MSTMDDLMALKRGPAEEQAKKRQELKEQGISVSDEELEEQERENAGTAEKPS